MQIGRKHIDPQHVDLLFDRGIFKKRKQGCVRFDRLLRNTGCFGISGNHFIQTGRAGHHIGHGARRDCKHQRQIPRLHLGRHEAGDATITGRRRKLRPCLFIQHFRQGRAIYQKDQFRIGRDQRLDLLLFFLGRLQHDQICVADIFDHAGADDLEAWIINMHGANNGQPIIATGGSIGQTFGVGHISDGVVERCTLVL